MIFTFNKGTRLVMGLALAAMLAPAPAGAQAAPPRDSLVGVTSGISFGVRVGASVAKLVSEQEASTQGRIAPAAGIYGEMRFNRWSSLVVDVMYNEAGGNGVNPVPFYRNDSLSGRKLERMNVRAQGIEIPIQVKLRPSLGGSIVPYVNLGASPAFYLGTTSHNYIIQDSTVLEVGLDMDPVIEPWDVAGLGALGIEVRSTRLRWSVELYTRFGFTRFNQPQKIGMTGYSASASGVKIGFGR